MDIFLATFRKEIGDIVGYWWRCGWVRYASNKLCPDGGFTTLLSDLYGDSKIFSYVFYFGQWYNLTFFLNYKNFSENAYTLR
jgi:hypothetical protein